MVNEQQGNPCAGHRCTWSVWLLLPPGRVCGLARKGRWACGTVSWLTLSSERGRQTADVQGPRGCCSGKEVRWPMCFDDQAPSPVTSGLILQVIFSLTCPVFIKKNVVPSHVLSTKDFQLEIQTSIRDHVFLPWVDWNLAQSKETMWIMIELSSLEHLTCAKH